jgi:hypothetical protein
MQLLTAHRLTEPHDAAHPTPNRSPTPPRDPRPSRATPPSAHTRRLAADERDVQSWAETLDDNSRLIRQLALKRGWSSRTIHDLNIGFDGTRITIPIRSGDGTLRGVLRYDPFGRRDPKMLAIPGTRLGLVPHPAREPADRIILVEGPPDMIAARSCRLPAIAIPGTTAWQPSWAELLAGRHVTIVMDCDPPGRRAAAQIATTLRTASIATELVDLWPDRSGLRPHRPHPQPPAYTRRLAGAPHRVHAPAPDSARPSKANAGTRPQHPGGRTMTEIADPGGGDYTTDARRAILQAARVEHDFGGWLGGVLASVSAQLGTTDALTAGRPGSWEADLVQQLVKGTVGYDDDCLADYRDSLP